MSELSDIESALLLPTQVFSASGTAKPTRTRARRKAEGPKKGTPLWWTRWIEKTWSWGLVGNYKGLGDPVTASNERFDLWTCTACGAPMIFSRQPGRHAGPRVRALDPRYGFARCYRVSEAWSLIKDQPHRSGEVVLFRHDSRPQSAQPTQASSLADLPSSWKDPSRTYGTFPGGRRRGPSNIEGARSVVVPTVDPRGGTVRITALDSTQHGPISSKATSPTSGSPSTDGSPQPSAASTILPSAEPR